MKNLSYKPGKVRIYKLSNGVILRTGSYIDSDSSEELLADKSKVDWVACIEVDESDTTDVHLAQLDILNGVLTKDLDWTEKLMPPAVIVDKRVAKLKEDAAVEIAKELPDTVRLMKIYNERDHLRTLKRVEGFRTNPPKEVYELAILGLNERVDKGEPDKPMIRAQLEEKIAEKQ